MERYELDRYMLFDESDPWHPVNIGCVQGFDRAKEVRKSHMEAFPDAKVNIYRVSLMEKIKE